MNQSILFPDIQVWDEEQQQVRFPVQQGGALIECVISLSRLQQISSRSLVTENDALDAFSHARFDIEDWVEGLIEDEEFNQHGQVDLG
ncbi:DUF1488 domain-containing protein [Vibrio sp. FNV 38]|nr:DUF1488 domain-containing protein [Vibrio sp. FNV 38]